MEKRKRQGATAGWTKPSESRSRGTWTSASHAERPSQGQIAQADGATWSAPSTVADEVATAKSSGGNHVQRPRAKTSRSVARRLLSRKTAFVDKKRRYVSLRARKRPSVHVLISVSPGQIFQNEVSFWILITYRRLLSTAPRFREEGCGSGGGGRCGVGGDCCGDPLSPYSGESWRTATVEPPRAATAESPRAPIARQPRAPPTGRAPSDGRW